MKTIGIVLSTLPSLSRTSCSRRSNSLNVGSSRVYRRAICSQFVKSLFDIARPVFAEDFNINSAAPMLNLRIWSRSIWPSRNLLFEDDAINHLVQT